MKKTYKEQGKSNRAKGFRFEREVVKDLRGIGFEDAKRHLEYQYQESYGVDIDNVGIFRIQCKNKKRYVTPKVLDEIKLDGIKIVVSKALRKKPVAILYWEDMLKLMEAYEKLRTSKAE